MTAADFKLDRLNPVEMDASNRTECLTGTRANIIEFIED
jgi:hypothetical protein